MSTARGRSDYLSNGSGPAPAVRVKGMSALQVAMQAGAQLADGTPVTSALQFAQWLQEPSNEAAAALVDLYEAQLITIGELQNSVQSLSLTANQAAAVAGLADTKAQQALDATANPTVPFTILPESDGWRAGFATKDALGNYCMVSQPADKQGPVLVVTVGGDCSDVGASLVAATTYVPPDDPEPLSPDIPFDRTIIIWYGQSPGKFTIGVIGPKVNGVTVPTASYYEPVDMTASPRHKMLSNGLHREIEFPGQRTTTLVPRQEHVFISGSYYSGGGAGGWDSAAEQMRENEDEVLPSAWPRAFVHANPARSGQNLQQLSNPGGPWNDLLYCVRDIVAAVAAENLANDTSYTVGLGAVIYDQGAANNEESNGGDGPLAPEFSHADYRDGMVQFHDDVVDLAVAECPDQDDIEPYTIILQDDSSYSRPNNTDDAHISNAGNVWVADAQVEAAKLRDHILVPDGQVSIGAVGVHFQPVPYWLKGMMTERGWKRAWFDGEPEPLRIPTSVIVDSNNPTVGLALFDWMPEDHVIAIDTTRVSKQTRYGISVRTDALWPASGSYTLAADPTLVGEGPTSAIRFVTTTPMTAGAQFEIGTGNSGHNFRTSPVDGPVLIDAVTGADYEPWLLRKRVPITFQDSPLPALSATPVPPPAPGPPPGPALAIYPPQAIMGDDCVYLANAEYTDGLGLTADPLVDKVTDVVNGSERIKLTDAGRPTHLPTGWHNGTAALRADGVANYLVTRTVPNEFPANVPTGNAYREYWFIGKNEALTSDGDTLRPIGGWGNSNGTYFTLLMRLTGGNHRIATAMNSTIAQMATELTIDVSGYFYARAFTAADGTGWYCEVGNANGFAISSKISGTLVTALGKVVLFGSPSSGATAFKGLWKTDWILKAPPTTEQLDALRAYALSELPEA